MIFTHLKKSNITKLVCNAINIIETQYNDKIVFFLSDREKALGKEFNKLLVTKEITWKPLASNSSEQNGHSERKGGILSMKAQALCIDASFLIYLWPEIFQTTSYLVNCTPIRKHGWKTVQVGNWDRSKLFSFVSPWMQDI